MSVQPHFQVVSLLDMLVQLLLLIPSSGVGFGNVIAQASTLCPHVCVKASGGEILMGQDVVQVLQLFLFQFPSHLNLKYYNVCVRSLYGPERLTYLLNQIIDGLEFFSQ